MTKIHKIHFNAGQIGDSSEDSPSINIPNSIRGLIQNDSLEFQLGIDGAPQPSEEELVSRDAGLRSWNKEHAARYFIQTVLEDQNNESLLEITSPQSPSLVPNLKLRESRDEQLSGSQMLSFDQTAHSIPIFGTSIVIEIETESNKLIAIDGSLAETPNIDPSAKLTWQEALQKLVSKCNAEITEIKVQNQPILSYFEDEENDSWHLVYHFKNLPINPPEEDIKVPDNLAFDISSIESCSHAFIPGVSAEEFDYLVDAKNGDIKFWFSSTPTLNIPIPCTGIDETGVQRDFYGFFIGSDYELHDPLRNISTYDFSFGVISPVVPTPTNPIRNSSTSFQISNTAAVSAHYYATVVYDFFNNLLKRQGVDGKGMLLKSVVNVTDTAGNRTWANAAWYRDHMWYGQKPDASGVLKSYSQNLDIIGHELAHGVTEKTSNLVYAHLSGALNESFSDIFGILIKHWDSVTGFPPVRGWSWDLGLGLGRGGGAIRNFRFPANVNQPDHFSQYVRLPNNRQNDYGGVHIYSGIHNRAVSLILTDTDSSGNSTIPPKEVAILYYLTLTKLTARSSFLDCRRTLVNVAGTYYNYDQTKRQINLQLINDCYDTVGIV